MLIAIAFLAGWIARGAIVKLQVDRTQDYFAKKFPNDSQFVWYALFRLKDDVRKLL